MDTQNIWSILSGIRIGTIVSWLIVIGAIIAAISATAIKIFKMYDLYLSEKKQKEELIEKTKEHEETDKIILSRLDAIQNELDEQRDTKIKELRHQLVMSGEAALVRGCMTIREWRSFSELFVMYTEKYKQNTYVQSLYERVERDVKITGALDEHGYDME